MREKEIVIRFKLPTPISPSWLVPIGILFIGGAIVWAGTGPAPLMLNTFDAGQPISSSQMNANFNTLNTVFGNLQTPCQFRYDGFDNYGSTNPAVPRLIGVAESNCPNSAITADNDNAQKGATFTIQVSGVYAISFSAGGANAVNCSAFNSSSNPFLNFCTDTQVGQFLGLWANSDDSELSAQTEPDFTPTAVPPAHFLARTDTMIATGTTVLPQVSWTGYLAQGTIVHPTLETSGAAFQQIVLFSISKVTP